MFTLWSGEALLGTAELKEAPGQPHMRIGAFRPTDAGLAVLPTLCEAVNASKLLGPMLQREGITRARLGDDLGHAIQDALHRTPEGRHMVAANTAVQALHLELRDETGRQLRTTYISVQDIWASFPDMATLPMEAQAEAEAFGVSRYLLCAVLESFKARAASA